jgi:LysR family transcriptional activator of mexEF-oprN operon
MEMFDFNLLRSLSALLAHGSVTKAAVEVGISQSAMSYNLARLRKAMDDELFTRDAGGLVMTPYARKLLEPLSRVMSDIDLLVTRAVAFDPATTERTFTVALPDASEVLIVPEIVRRLRSEAPRIRLKLKSVDDLDVLSELDAGRIDMAVGVFTDGQLHHKRKLLHTDHYLCIFNNDLLGLSLPLRLEDYLSVAHALVTGSGARDVIGEELAKTSGTRRVALEAPHLLSVPFIVRHAPLIATIHAGLAYHFAGMLDLQTSPPPLALPTVPISLLWHTSNDSDAGPRWMRNLITSALKALRGAADR